MTKYSIKTTRVTLQRTNMEQLKKPTNYVDSNGIKHSTDL